MYTFFQPGDFGLPFLQRMRSNLAKVAQAVDDLQQNLSPAPGRFLICFGRGTLDFGHDSARRAIVHEGEKKISVQSRSLHAVRVGSESANISPTNPF